MQPVNIREISFLKNALPYLQFDFLPFQLNRFDFEVYTYVKWLK